MVNSGLSGCVSVLCMCCVCSVLNCHHASLAICNGWGDALTTVIMTAWCWFKQTLFTHLNHEPNKQVQGTQKQYAYLSVTAWCSAQFRSVSSVQDGMCALGKAHDDDVGLHVLGCRVDILGTNCSRKGPG